MEQLEELSDAYFCKGLIYWDFARFIFADDHLRKCLPSIFLSMTYFPILQSWNMTLDYLNSAILLYEKYYNAINCISIEYIKGIGIVLHYTKRFKRNDNLMILFWTLFSTFRKWFRNLYYPCIRLIQKIWEKSTKIKCRYIVRCV